MEREANDEGNGKPEIEKGAKERTERRKNTRREIGEISRREGMIRERKKE